MKGIIATNFESFGPCLRIEKTGNNKNIIHMYAQLEKSSPEAT